MQILMIAGNVGKDAVLRRTGGGDAVLNFSVAVDSGKDRDGNRRPTTWVDCSVWGKRAEALERHITKGCKLTLSGHPTVREHDGKAYLGMRVSELTFQGGGNRDESEHDDWRDDPPRHGAGAGGRPALRDLDDEIPFAPEWRA